MNYDVVTRPNPHFNPLYLLTDQTVDLKEYSL